ncbi:MAG: TetR/AcrR family transcriptional regulator [Spirochaetes bacterium]|nr:MAG: TetR/AcrR family transcriptional regulator [Spirochaetota bacterium]
MAHANDTVQDRTRSRRIPLYAEIGKYFSIDGNFDESAFRAAVRESLGLIAEKQPDRASFSEKAGQWLSAYLSNVTGYLEEKGMPDASIRLFKVAVEEAANAGVKDFSVPSQFLKKLMGRVNYPVPGKGDKRTVADSKKRQIFDAALHVFAMEGFQKATIDDIAALSGVGKGSVYRYFKSKDDLLEQLLAEKYREIGSQISIIFTRGTDILVQIQEAIEFWVKYVESNQNVYRLIHSEAMLHSSGKRDIFFGFLASSLPMIKERIVAINQEKRLKTTNFYTVFYGILGFIDGVVQKWLRCGMNYPLSDEIPVILEVLFNGFVGETKSGRRYFESPGGDKS